MNPGEVMKFYKSYYRFGQKTMFTPQALCQWVKVDHIPIDSQIKLQAITEGHLKADIDGFIANVRKNEGAQYLDAYKKHTEW